MARPLNADADRTRRQILEAAIRRFGEHGVKGTTLRAIAGDVGVTFATVHHHFGSKAELFERCLEAGYASLSDLEPELAAALSGASGDAEAQLRALSRRAFRHAMERREVSRFLLRATLYERSVPDRARIDAAHRTYLDVASAVLSPVVDRPADSLRVPLQGLMFLLTRLAVMSETERATVGARPEELETYVADVAACTLMGGRR